VTAPRDKHAGYNCPDIINGALVILSSAGHINGQVDPADLKWPAAKAASPLYVNCLPDPTNRDIAYHSIKADREMWPMVEALAMAHLLFS